MKVFISWSGKTSKAVAAALHDWLPTVIQPVEPWMSTEDLEQGTRWGAEIAERLGNSVFAVVCLTDENLSAPWTLFESGALYEALGPTSVVSYLLGVDPSRVAGPLAQFQATTSDEQGTLELARSINKSLFQGRMGESALAKSFARSWPELRAILDSIDETSAAKPSELTDDREASPDLPSTPPILSREQSNAYQRARDFYRKHQDELARDYSGKYVAIIGSKVVDHDEDFGALARRVFESGGIRPVFMPRIGSEGRIVRMPSREYAHERRLPIFLPR